MTFIDCITTVAKVAVIEIPLAVLAVARDGPEAVRVPLRVSLPAAVGGEMGQRGTLGGTDGVQTRDGRRNNNRANFRHYLHSTGCSISSSTLIGSALILAIMLSAQHCLGRWDFSRNG